MLALLRKVFTRQQKPLLLPEVSWVPSFCDLAEDWHHYTPDAVELFQYPHHLLFVCDELMTGHREAGLITGRKVEGAAFTQHNFTMRRHDIGTLTYPIVSEKKEKYGKTPHLPIRGELWRVPPETICQLDKYKINGVHWTRKTVMVVQPHTALFFKNITDVQKKVDPHRTTGLVRGVHGVDRGHAFMYVAKEEVWGPLVNDFHYPAVRTFRNEKGVVKEFYYFDPDEYGAPF